MKLTWRRVNLWGTLAAIVVVGACSSGLTDTPFSGTWERGRDTFSRSVIAISNEAGEFRFRVDRYNDGAHVLRCPRQGVCAIYDGDAPVYELIFDVKFDEGEDALFVDCTGTPLDGISTPVHWVERLSVTADGTELLVQRVELNRRPRTDGPRRFQKISDDPF
jgi:hypothetical protein